MERYLCDTCLYANNCQFIAKHKERATGCSAYINTFGVSVDRIRELCAAERDGRCVVLPCKVGDTVYAPFRKEVKEYKIERVDIKGICFDSEDGAWIFLKHIQDGTVFLTREEAEAALAKGESHG